MKKSNAKVIIQTRSSVDRRRVKSRRSFPKQEYLGHKRERRADMIGRRMNGDRRKVLSDIMNTFWKKDL